MALAAPDSEFSQLECRVPTRIMLAAYVANLVSPNLKGRDPVPDKCPYQVISPGTIFLLLHILCVIFEASVVFGFSFVLSCFL